MRRTVYIAVGLCVCGLLLRGGARAAPGSQPPVIKHDPVKVAVRGQPIAIRAVVSSSAPVKAVSLFYATSKDTAPFKLPMEHTGAGAYFVSISSGLLAGAQQVSYYIEAIGEADATAETPWYKVQIASAAAGGPGAAAAAQPGTAPSKEPFWNTQRTLLAAGGAVVLGGAALAASSGGGGGGGGGNSATNTAGVYTGSATVCLEMAGASPTCSSHGTTIVVTQQGLVTSEDLYNETHMEASLAGSDFTLSAPLTDSGLTGEIRFRGTILSGRIVGNVEGSVTSTGGTQGSYSGAFSAARQ